MLRCRVELLGGLEKEVGRGLDAWCVAASNDGVEIFCEIESVEPTIDPAVR